MWRSEDNRWDKFSSSTTWDTGMELGWVRFRDKCLYLLSHLTSPRRHTLSHDIINLTFPIPPILYYQKELTAVSLIGTMMSLACFSKLKVNNLWRVKKRALPSQPGHSQVLQHRHFVSTKKQTRKWKQMGGVSKAVDVNYLSSGFVHLPCHHRWPKGNEPKLKISKEHCKDFFAPSEFLNIPNFKISTFQSRLMCDSSHYYSLSNTTRVPCPRNVFSWEYGTEVQNTG